MSTNVFGAAGTTKYNEVAVTMEAEPHKSMDQRVSEVLHGEFPGEPDVSGSPRMCLGQVVSSGTLQDSGQLEGLTGTVQLRDQTTAPVLRPESTAVEQRATSSSTGSQMSLPVISADLLRKERMAHDSACNGLLGLRNMLQVRQHNRAAFAGLDNRRFARLYLVTYVWLAFFRPALLELRNIKTTFHAQVVVTPRETDDPTKACLLCIGGLLSCIIQSFYVPLLVLPRILVGTLMLCIYPIVALALLAWLFVLAEWNTAIVSTLLTANIFAPAYLRVLLLVECQSNSSGSELTRSVSAFARNLGTDASKMGVDVVSSLMRTEEAQNFATQLQRSHHSSGIMESPGGFMTENPRYIQELLQGKRKRDQKDIIINVYTWRALKICALIWHAVVGIGVLAALTYLIRESAPSTLISDGVAYFRLLDAVWAAYACLWAAVLTSFFSQVIEEQHRLYQTKDIFAMDIFPRLSRLWLDFGIFSVTTPTGQRSKLREVVHDFTTKEFEPGRPNLSPASRFTVAKLVTGRPKDAALGIHPYLGVPDQQIWHGMSRGTEAIIEEFKHNGTAEDNECLHYVLHQRAGSSRSTFQDDLMRDCDAAGRLLPERRLPSGEGMLLSDFVAHSSSREANLLEAHVLALRLYTTAAFRSINTPLRKGQRPHPLPITVAFISDGVRRLRAVASAAHDADQPQDFWRGMRDLNVGGSERDEDGVPDGFLAQGGTEQAPMSTSENFAVALRYSAGAMTRLIMKITTKGFMDRGANLRYLSAFPAESEFLYPPLTFLQPTSLQETVEVPIPSIGKGGTSMVVTFTVIEVEPRFGS
eukprot:Transcript_20232.p1 GENE.Transcript_20232~~Transcript_20232.p1  ORF type:complete len:815 (+),score=48.90 Transcript_20232:128-2572(+)